MGNFDIIFESINMTKKNLKDLEVRLMLCAYFTQS